MSRDFTLDKYSELMQSLKKNYTILTVAGFLEEKYTEPVAILRHDVDKFPARAVRMAKLEKGLDIRSTYYFRWAPDGFPAKEIKECLALGHEVGYHYENLSELKDMEKAIKDFEEKLALFRKIAPAKTVAMHGAPMSKFRNADMLAKINLSKYKLLGEPHLSPKFQDVAYLTDSGRTWSSGSGSVRDTLGKPVDEKVKSTTALISLIEARKYPKLMVSAHPQRWSAGTGEWVREAVGQNVKNVGKRLIK